MTGLLAVLVDSFSDSGDSSGLSLLATPFMRNALIAGTLVAIAAGVVGYFVILRDLPFATHAVAHIGFPGATLAALVGWSPVAGLVVACLGGAGAIAALSHRLRDREIVTGTVLAFASGLGILFTSVGSGQSGMVTSILFGNVLAVTIDQIVAFAIITVVVLGTLGVVGRRLLFASLDPEVAEAKGVRVRALGAAFLAAMSLVVAGAITVVGVLLIFALIVTPAAAAIKITARPGRVIALSIAIAITAVWGGLVVVMFVPWPPSFAITTIACGIWLAVSQAARLSENRVTAGHASLRGA